MYRNGIGGTGTGRGMGFRTNGLIPRYKIPAVHRYKKRLQSNDSFFDSDIDDRGYEYTFEKIVAMNCTIQQPKPVQLAPEEQGIEQDQRFMLITDTPVSNPIDGTEFMGSSIYIPDSWFTVIEGFTPVGKGGWFNVTRLYNALSDVINHYHVEITKDTSAIDSHYPDISALLPFVDTRANYLLGDWEETWLS